MNCITYTYRSSNTVFGCFRNVLHNRPAVITSHAVEYSKSAEERLGLSKPKKPSSPFFRFASQLRPALYDKHPGTDAITMMKLIGQHWQKVETQVKQKLIDEYEKDKEQYLTSKAKFELSLSDEQKDQIKALKEDLNIAKEKRKLRAEYKKLGRPKRAMSSYLLFAMNEKSQIKSMGVADFQLKMTNKWKALTPAQKAVWEEKAEALRADYKRDIAAWEEKMIRLGNIDVVRSKALIVEKAKSKQ